MIKPRKQEAFFRFPAFLIRFRRCQADQLVFRLAFIHFDLGRIMAYRDMQPVLTAISRIMGGEHFAQSADLNARIAVSLNIKILGTAKPVHCDLIGLGRVPRVGNGLFHQIAQQLGHDWRADEIGGLQKRAGFGAEQIGSLLFRDRRRHYLCLPL